MSDACWLTDERIERLDAIFRRATAVCGVMIDVTCLKAHRTASSLPGGQFGPICSPFERLNGTSKGA